MKDPFDQARSSLDGYVPRPAPARRDLALWPKSEGRLRLSIFALTLAAAATFALGTAVLFAAPGVPWIYPLATAMTGLGYFYLALRGTERLMKLREQQDADTGHEPETHNGED